MTLPRVIWSETLHCGGTTDGYSAEITRSAVGGIVLCVRAPVGNPLYQPCVSIDLAKAHAETEIQHHRERKRWTA